MKKNDCNENENVHNNDSDSEAVAVSQSAKPAKPPQRFTCFSPHCTCCEEGPRCGDCVCCVGGEW